MHWLPAYIGLGSNLDDPPARVAAAFDALDDLPQTQLILRSRLYRSRPLGPVPQPDFCNAVAALLTGLTPHALLCELRALETRLGRQPPRERWGPRHIDLDLLAYDGLQVEDPELRLPHPGIVARSFVLYPLAELAPQLWLPGMGQVAALARAVDAQGIELHRTTQSGDA